MSIDVMEPMRMLDRDLKLAARLLGRREARYLTDRFYQVQDQRKTSANQIRSLGGQEPSTVLSWVLENSRRLEANIERALGIFAREYKVGAWLQSITGIGPVISAGLLAHIELQPWQCSLAKADSDVKACTEQEPHEGAGCRRRTLMTAGHFHSFAGYNPNVKWEKGKKRPWNADLKCLLFNAGECFIKFQNHQNDYYGKLYLKRKEYEIKRNEAGELREKAEAVLAEKKIGKSTEVYKHYSAGRLPPAHIHARARRWTVKIFLSHLHHAMYVDCFGTEPPMPYVFSKHHGEHWNHSHFIPLPNWPFEGGGKSLNDMDK